MLRRVDPLGPLFAVLGLAVFLVHGLNGTLTRDLALYAYSGQQFAHGVPPYVAVLNRAGPLAHIVPGIGATVAGWLGTDDLLTERVISTVMSAGLVWLVYVVGRDLYGSKLTGAIAATSLLTIRTFMFFATGGSREKITMMLLITLALWAVLHWRWGWAGVFVSLATLTWQPSFFLGAATALAAMAGLRGGELARALVRFCLGGAIPAGLALVGFLVVGALGPFLQGFLLINLRYTKQKGLLEFLAHKDDLLHDGYGASLGVIVVGLVAVTVNAILVWRRAEGRQDPRVRAQIAMGVGVTAAVLCSMKALNGWPDMLYVVPTAVLGFAHFIHWSALHTPRPHALAVLCSVVAFVLALVAAAGTRGDGLTVQRAAVRSVFQIAGDDATVASIAAPAPLVLAHKTNPVRYQMFTGGFDEYVDDTYPGGLAGLAQHLADLRPTFLTVDEAMHKYRWIRPTLAHYVRIGRTADVNWFARDDLARREIQRLRTTLDQRDPSTSAEPGDPGSPGSGTTP